MTIDASTITPIPAVESEAETVAYGGTYDLTDNITNLPEGATVEDVTPEGIIDVNKTGNYTGKVKVTFENGSSKVVDVPVTVGESQAATNEPTGQDVTVKKGETPNAEDAISNLTDLPEGTLVDWKETPDTSTPGDKQATVVVTYPDGSTDEKELTITVKNIISAGIIEDIAKTTKVTTETIPGKVNYEADESLNFEEKVVDKAPVDGEKEITTVSEPGKEDVVTEEIIKEAKDGKTRIGNKKVETTQNEDGSTTTTTTIYDVDPETGELTNPTTTTKTTMPATPIEDIAKPIEDYLAIFNANGGTPTTQKVTVKDGEVVKGVTEPTREGYKFVKWVKLGTDNTFDLSTPFSKDLLDADKTVFFTAVWEKEVAENGDSAIVYPIETHPIFKTVGDDLTEEEVTNAIVVLGLDRSQYTVTINEGQEVPSTDKAGDYIIDVTITYKDGTTEDAQVAIIITESDDAEAPTIDAANVIAVEGQPIPPVMVDVDDPNASVKVEALPEGLIYNPETKQIEGTVPKSDDWKDGEEVRELTATIIATNEEGKTTTKDITVTILRDTDGDGTPDATDTDDDNDGVSDEDEKEKGTDPKDPNSKPGKITESIDPILPERTEVGDVNDLTQSEREHVKEAIEEANKDNFPEGTDVTVNEDGSATITYPDGSEDKIKAEDLIKQAEEEISQADQIDPIVPDRTEVGDVNDLTESEREHVKEAIEEANKDNFPEGTDVTVNEDGSATITYPDGSKDSIPADQLIFQREDDSEDNKKKPSLADQIDITLPEKTGVKDINNLTEIEKEKVKIAITDANKLPKGTEVLVGSKGDVIINFPDGSHIVIDRDKIVYHLADSDAGKPADPDKGGTPSKPGTGDVSDSKGGDKDSSMDSKAKDSQDKLPQTGESSSAAILGLAGLSIMAGLGLVAGRRKEDN